MTQETRLAGVGRAEGRGDGRLRLHVLYTGMRRTGAALRRAEELAKELGGTIALMAALVVPYPLGLGEPSVAPGFWERRLRMLALDVEWDVDIQIYLCRDRVEALRGALRPRSVVLIGAGGWWFAPERRLARRLRQDGHVVSLVDASASQSHFYKHAS